MKRTTFNRFAVPVLGALLLLPSMAPIAEAAIVPTQAVVAGAARDANLSRIERALQSERLQAEFLRQGVTPEAINGRLAGLSDAELASLADRIDRQPAGGDGLFALLGVVFVVLLVLDLTDTVHVFHHPAKSGKR